MNTVLRLARTYPREDMQGIGLHCRYYALYSNRKSIILTKAMTSPPLSYRDDTIFEQVAYSDIPAPSEKMGLLSTIRIGSTKIYGELVFLKAAIMLLRKQEKRPTVIHVHSINYLFTGVVLKFLYRIPLCLNFGGLDLVRGKKLWPYRMAFKYLDAAFYVARQMEPDLYSIITSEQGVYTANGYDPEMFACDGKVRENQIIAVGNLRWIKDYINMIDAFAKVADRFPEYTLKIIGEGGDRPKLEARIKELSLQDRIFLVGYKTHQEIRHELNVSKLYMMSSATEGLPKSMIEAMACGLPVLCTDVGDCDLIKKDAGVAVQSRDPEALGSALNTLLAHPEHLAELSELALKRSQDFSWQKVSKRVEEAYDDLEEKYDK